MDTNLNILLDNISQKIEILNEMGISVFYKHPETIEELCAEINNCQKCPSSNNKIQVVLGEGNINADIIFAGEALINPFCEISTSQLLDKIIEAMGITKKEIYITDIFKCKNSSDNYKIEKNSCGIYLHYLLEITKPKFICTFGNMAANILLNTNKDIFEIRGKICDYRNIKLIPTLHPQDCINNPENKKLVWEDIKKVMKIAGLTGDKKLK